MKNQRIFHLILTFVLTFSWFSLGYKDSYAQIPHEVHIRIEGSEQTLYDRVLTVTEDVYCQDYLNNLGHNILNGWITTLFNETHDGTYSDYWMNYFVKDDHIDSSKTVADYKLTDADEIVLYAANFDEHINNGSGTLIPIVDVNNQEDTVTLKVYGKNGIETTPYKEANLKISYMGEKKTDTNGKHVFKTQGIQKIQIGDYPEFARKTIYVGEKNILQKVENAIEEIKNHYVAQETFNSWVAPAYFTVSKTNEDFQAIHDKYTTTIDENSGVNNYAHHIIGLLAAGKNPRNVDGKDYVQMLVNCQQSNGQFLKHAEDSFYVTYQSFAILALDLAQANYNQSKAIEAILADQNADGSFGTWGTDGTAIALFALANHKNEPGVPAAIEKALSNLKNQQTITGGFMSFGNESAETTAMVMKALIALDINPLSEAWTTESGNNMLDALLAYKQGGQFIAAWSNKVNAMTTEQAFSALVDLYKAESMYQNQILQNHYKYTNLNEISLPIYDFTLTRNDTTIFENNKEAQLNITIENGSNKAQQITCIVALYKLNGEGKELYTYTFLSKTISANSTEDFSGGFLIPVSGDYEVKAMLWDSFENKKPLAEPITIDVQ